MKKIFERSDLHAWEKENGDRLTVAKANTYKGVYWTVTFIPNEGKFKILGTRCTWQQAMAFLAEFEKG